MDIVRVVMSMSCNQEMHVQRLEIAQGKPSLGNKYTHISPFYSYSLSEHVFFHIFFWEIFSYFWQISTTLVTKIFCKMAELNTEFKRMCLAFGLLISVEKHLVVWSAMPTTFAISKKINVDNYFSSRHEQFLSWRVLTLPPSVCTAT